MTQELYNNIMEEESSGNIIYKNSIKYYFQCNLINQIYKICVKIEIPSLFNQPNKFIMSSDKVIITKDIEVINKLKIDEKERIMKEKIEMLIEEEEEKEESNNDILTVMKIPSLNITFNCEYSNIYSLQYCYFLHNKKHTNSLPICIHNDYIPHVKDCDSETNNHLIYFTYDNTTCQSINPPNESYVKCRIYIYIIILIDILPSNSVISIVEIVFYGIVMFSAIIVTISLTVFRRFTNTTFSGKLYIALVYIISILLVMICNIIFQFININKNSCYFITCLDMIFFVMAILYNILIYILVQCNQ